MRAAAVMFALAAACGGTQPAGDPPIEGLPAIAQPWTTAQLAQAATTLDALCTSAPTRLPAYGSRTFERVVAADNRRTITGDTPAARAALHASNTGAVLALYGTYLRCGRPVETLAVNAALLEGYAASMPDGDAVIAALPPDSPEAAHKRAGRDQKIAGLRGGIISTVDMLADPALGPPVPAPLATRLGAAIGQVRAALPDGAVAESLAHLDAVIAAELDPARKQMLTTVRDAAR